MVGLMAKLPPANAPVGTLPHITGDTVTDPASPPAENAAGLRTVSISSSYDLAYSERASARRECYLATIALSSDTVNAAFICGHVAGVTPAMAQHDGRRIDAGLEGAAGIRQRRHSNFMNATVCREQ